MSARPIRLFHYRPHRRAAEINFGDTISPILVEALTGRPVIWSEVEGADLVAIGSVLQRVTGRRWYRPLRLRYDRIAVWGTGFVRPGPVMSLKFLDPLAVRGPRSLARLSGVGALPFGDPGILFAAAFAPKPGPAAPWGIVPHKSDIGDPSLAAVLAATPGARLIRPDAPPLETLSSIAGCERIVSSSLHGLVAADALGIPNWRIRPGGRITGGDHKFLDYAEGIGRADIAVRPLPGGMGPGQGLDAAGLTGDFGYQTALPARAERLAAVLRARFT